MRPLLGAALLVALTACSAGLRADPVPTLSPDPLPSASAGDTPTPADPTGAELTEFYAQQLHWKACRSGSECATVQVPLDYADPTSRSLTLPLLRTPAEDPRHRVGALVVNPGGPGVSGIAYAEQAASAFGPRLRRAFDIVGFDPRGVGVDNSDPIDCVDDATLDRYVASDPDPDTPAEQAESIRLAQELGQGCVAHSGDLVGHVSTPEAARDLDIIRAALGQGTLAYFGASYGTSLGATYADLFPDRVGRLVLDGALDPGLSTVKLSIEQARGFETALDSYLSHCVDGGDCFLGDTVEAARSRISALLTSLDATPLSTNQDRDLTEGTAVYGIWLPLYNRSSWPALDLGLRKALDGDGSTLLTLADQYVSRGLNGYTANTIEANLAINCLDHDDPPSAARAARLVARFEQVSPTFGRVFANGLRACADWPVQTGHGPQTLRAAGAAPILVVGTTRDPATPLQWAQALAGQLESGVLVTRDGDGHTGYLSGNACVDDAVEAYLVSGTVPSGDVDCP